MPFVIVALTLFAAMGAADADAETDAERLAEMFSPILILTEETGHKWGDIKVTKPEPVEIMGAQSADNLRFWAVSANQEHEIDSYLNWDPPVENQRRLGDSNVNFSQNKFAFFVNGLYVGDPPGSALSGQHIIHAYFDYPGTTPHEWNNEYMGSGARAGANHPNTAYVHIYKRVVGQYEATYDSVTVIQYKYFYPYNHWWNSHEGDWQGIDVVVSSSDPNTATILGVEYRFHGAWLNYYKGWGSNPGLTTNFVFNPRTAVKLSPGPTRNGLIQYTHPVVYVGAGSHGGYPIGGKIQTYYDLVGSYGDFEYMTHTGLVLATQAPASGSSLWESYDLQLLPEPKLNNTDNMGLAGDMSWLGARIRWGTPDVFGIGISESPHGPYNSNSEDWGESKGWGELKFFNVGTTGKPPYEMHHRDLPNGAYHHWAIIGDETWSGTVNLLGDVVVFPGATLTLEAGTVVEFASQTDRHQFSRAFSPSLSCLSEIFVYGTLTSEGDSGNRVVFRGPSGSTKSDDWGGIHQLTGGEVTVGNHTDVLNGTPIEYEFPPGSGIFSKCPPTYPAPVLIGALDPEVEESLIPEGVPPSPVDVGVYTNTNPNSNQPVWSLIGADASTFSLVQTSNNSANERTLQFKEPPNYEVPLVGDGYKTTYDIGVVVKDVPLSRAVGTNGAALADTLLVTVEVTNVEEAGSVVLSPLPPRVEVPLVARLTDPDEGLTFTGASWAWQRRADDTADWEPVSTGAVRATENYPELSSYRPQVSDVGYQLQATVSYTDNHGPNKSAESDPTAAVVGGLGLSGPDERDVAEVVLPETEPRVIATYEATAAEGVTVGWSLAGPDQDAFVVRDGVLTFASGPDYEAPTDAGHATDEDGNNVYHVTVQAMAGEQTATLVVQVAVTNVDDPGMVTLSSTQPEVDEPITATLTDQDGSVEHVRWSWSYFSSEDGPLNGEPTVVSSSDELIPSGVLMGLRLQARALYADEFGTHQSAESVQTEPVVGRPSAPQNLTATPSDGSLVLAWDAPSLAGYPAFSGYRYRYKATKGTGWLPSATGALVDQTTRPTLEEGLIHGKEHTVEVWAVNAQGAGPAATTTATPPSPDTPGRVELTSMRPRVGVPLTATLVDPDAPVRVRRWRWQQSPWYYRSAGDSSLVAPSAARYPELASYEPTVSAIGRRLRAVVDYTDQYGTPSAQSAWTAPVQPGWPKAPALSATAGDAQVALTWTAAADQGAAIIRYQYHRSDKSGKWLDVPGDGLDGHYTVEGLSNDTDYTFKVRAVNSAGEGSPSNAVTATPQGPADPNPHGA